MEQKCLKYLDLDFYVGSGAFSQLSLDTLVPPAIAIWEYAYPFGWF